LPVLVWAVLATRDPGVVVSRSAVVTVGAPHSTSRAVSGPYRTGLGVKRRPQAGTAPSPVLCGRGVPEFYLHDNVGQQISHPLRESGSDPTHHVPAMAPTYAIRSQYWAELERMGFNASRRHHRFVFPPPHSCTDTLVPLPAGDDQPRSLMTKSKMLSW